MRLAYANIKPAPQVGREWLAHKLDNRTLLYMVWMHLYYRSFVEGLIHEGVMSTTRALAARPAGGLRRRAAPSLSQAGAAPGARRREQWARAQRDGYLTLIWRNATEFRQKREIARRFPRALAAKALAA